VPAAGDWFGANQFGSAHHLALVRSIAQSAVVLRQGTVAEPGPVEQVLEHPADPYTQRLMEDVPKLRPSGNHVPPRAAS
jgi:ABC-type glutathione transport system ATPase component